MRSTENTPQGTVLIAVLYEFYKKCIFQCLYNKYQHVFLQYVPVTWWNTLPDKGFLLDSDHKGFQLLELEAHDLGPCWNNSTCSPTLKLFLSARNHMEFSIINLKLTHNTVEPLVSDHPKCQA